MIKALYALPLLALASCAALEGEASNTKTGAYEKYKLMVFMGSESYESAGGARWTGNRVKNSGQAIQAVGAAVAGKFAATATESNNALKAQEATTAAGVTTTIENNKTAVELARIAAEQEAAKALLVK